MIYEYYYWSQWTHFIDPSKAHRQKNLPVRETTLKKKSKKNSILE